MEVIGMEARRHRPHSPHQILLRSIDLETLAHLSGLKRRRKH
jgi:hypothetical protein